MKKIFRKMGRFASRIIIGFVAFTVIAQFLSPLAVLAEEEQPISTQIWPVPADSVVSATQSIEKTLEAPKLVSLDAAAASKSDKGPSKSNIVNLASAAATGNSVSSSMNNGTPISALESIASNNLPDIDQNTGALQYGFPLAVPKGRNGMQPNLTLKYNSSDKEQNSIFGYGWSIDIPYIQRLNKNGFEEMYYNSVNGKSFYSSIDGEIKSPSNTINGSYLPRMENGSFNKYSFSSSNNQWTVTAKDGTQYKFGYDANARQDGALPFSPFTANYKWMLQEIRDTNNNYITFSYYKDAGQIYPDAIKYTGSGSTDGVYEIDFLRTGRPDNVIGSYDTGFAVTSNYYINEIDVKVNGNWVTKYTLNYGMNSTNTRSLLNSITATAQAADGTVTALPAQTFAYQNSISSWAKSTSLALPHVRYTGNSDGSGEIKGGYERFVDLNADGLLDYVDYAFLYPMQYSDGTLSYYPQSNVYINQGNGWSQQAGWNLPADTFFKYAKADSGMDYQFSDLNGDGYPDLIESYIDYTSSSEAVKTAVYLNTGSGWSLSPNWTLPSYANSQYPAKSINGIFFSDINGDTLPDAFVTIANCDYRSGITCGLGTTIVYYNNGSGYYWYLNPWPSSLQLRPADLNTDSVPELNSMSYAANTAQSKIYHDGLTEWNRKLTVWNPYSSVSLDSFATSHNSLVFPNTLFADVDNDDRTDFVSYYIKPDILNKSIFVSGNKNNYLNGFSSGVPLNLPLDNTVCATANTKPDSPCLLQFADLNGDGLQDYIQIAYGDTSSGAKTVDVNSATFINSGAKQDLLQSINYPQGGSTSISYKTAAQYPGNKSPYPLQVVSQITNNDGAGNTFGSTYSYAGGSYYYGSATDRQFAGFSQVTQTDAAGNVVKTYFHTGKGADSANGEYQDSFYKIGKVYRTEAYNNAGNLYQANINKWDQAALATGSSFVYLAQTVEEDFDGQTTHRDKAQTFSYDNATGNMTLSVNLGEVAANMDGSFSDLGSDKYTVNYTYAAPVSGSNVAAAISGVLTLDQNSNKIKEARFYYDGLALGNVGLGNQTEEENWVSASNYVNTQKTYNSYGLATQSIDANGNATNFVYDSYNLYPATVTNALGQSVKYVYNYANGQPTQTTDVDNFVFNTTYDGFGRVLTQNQPDLVNPGTLVTKSAFAYNDSSNNISVRETDYLDAAASVASYSYSDGLGRVIQTKKSARNGNFETKDLAYDNRGNVQKESLPYFTATSAKTGPTTAAALYTTHTYDSLGRKTASANALGTTATNYKQWQTTVTDANGNARDYFSDAFGNLVKVIERNGTDLYTTAYAYNGLGNLLNINDAASNVRNFTYDGLGRTITAQDLHAAAAATFGSRSYAYDAAGDVVTLTDAKNLTTSFVYDSLNRKKTESVGGSVMKTFTYDNCVNGVGRLCQVAMPGETESFEYNPLGGMAKDAKTRDSQVFATAYTYDRLGNKLSVTNPDGSIIRLAYNVAGLTESVSRQESTDANPVGVVASFDYSPAEQTNAANYASGIQTTETHDQNQLYRLTRKVSAVGATNLQDIVYQYDGVGNIKQIADNSATATKKTVVYAYDNLYRLTSAAAAATANDQDYSQVFTYDPLGNILTQKLNDTTLAYSYNGSNNPSADPDAVTSIVTTMPLPAPVINSFAAATSTIIAGTSVTLSWTLSGGAPDTLTIDNGVGSVLGKTSVSVKPAATTNYKLTATNASGTVSAAVKVTVVTIPVISAFSANPNPVNQGSATTLSWTLAGGTATSLTIDNSVGSVLGSTSKSVSPTAATTYKLTATNIAGTATKNVTVTVKVVAPTITAFTAVPNPVVKGSTVTLAWTLGGSAATTLSINQNVGSVLGKTSISVKPTTTTTYTLTAKNSAGTATKNVTITVKLAQSNDPLEKFARGITTPAAKILAIIADTFSIPTAYAANVVTTANYQYDASGNLLTDGKTSYTYDYQNRIVSATTGSTANGMVSNYSYDYQGQRDKSAVTLTATDAATGNVTTKATITYAPTGNYSTAVTTTTVKSSNGTVLSTTTAPAEITKHIFANGQSVATVKGSGTTAKAYYDLTDNLNGTTVVVDSANAIVETTDYYPFGAIRFDNQANSYSEKRKYIGQEYDAETSLSYLNSRYYNGTIGKFATEDPQFWGSQNLSDPQSLNAYSYSSNNPITLSDPSGQATLSSLLSSISNLLTTLKNSIGKIDSSQISAGLKLASDSLSYVSGAMMVVGGATISGTSIAGGGAISLGSGGALAIPAVSTSASAVALGIGVAAAGYGIMMSAGNNLSKDISNSRKSNNSSKSTNESVAKKIANGHAYDKHAAQFGSSNKTDFFRQIQSIMDNPSEVKPLENGRTAYWDNNSGTVVIHDPLSFDQGTAFKPFNGKNYFDALK